MLCLYVPFPVINMTNILTKVTKKFILLFFFMLKFFTDKNYLITSFTEIFTFILNAYFHMVCGMVFKEKFITTCTTFKFSYLINLFWITNILVFLKMWFSLKIFLTNFTAEGFFYDPSLSLELWHELNLLCKYGKNNYKIRNKIYWQNIRNKNRFDLK